VAVVVTTFVNIFVRLLDYSTTACNPHHTSPLIKGSLKGLATSKTTPPPLLTKERGIKGVR
jgi:hypothetical protein